MNKLFFKITLVIISFILQSNLLLCQTNKKEKLSRKEKVSAYPTTFGTKYFVTPSAIPQKENKLSVRNIELRFTSLEYSFTNNISIGAGFNMFSLFMDYEDPFPYFTTKVGFQIAPDIHVGGGVFLIQEERSVIDVFGMGMLTLSVLKALELS